MTANTADPARSDDEPPSADKLLQGLVPFEDKLLKQRQIVITGTINDKVAHATVQRLLAMAADGDDPITMFISSPGGHVESGDMIFDMVRFIRPKVSMVGTGWVASIAALIFVAVPKERRFCLPNTRFLLHQPSGGTGGPAADLAIQAEQIIKMRARLNKLIAEATGQPVKRVDEDTDRDYWMTPEEAMEYGMLGKVVTSVGEVG